MQPAAAAGGWVTLADGRTVRSDSPEWRAEAEARHVARMPSREDRRSYVDGVEAKRGKRAADELRALVEAVWHHVRRAAPADQAAGRRPLRGASTGAQE